MYTYFKGGMLTSPCYLYIYSWILWLLHQWKALSVENVLAYEVHNRLQYRSILLLLHIYVYHNAILWRGSSLCQFILFITLKHITNLINTTLSHRALTARGVGFGIYLNRLLFLLLKIILVLYFLHCYTFFNISRRHIRRSFRSSTLHCSSYESIMTDEKNWEKIN